MKLYLPEHELPAVRFYLPILPYSRRLDSETFQKRVLTREAEMS